MRKVTKQLNLKMDEKTMNCIKEEALKNNTTVTEQLLKPYRDLLEKMDYDNHVKEVMMKFLEERIIGKPTAPEPEPINSHSSDMLLELAREYGIDINN